MTTQSRKANDHALRGRNSVGRVSASQADSPDEKPHKNECSRGDASTTQDPAVPRCTAPIARGSARDIPACYWHAVSALGQLSLALAVKGGPRWYLVNRLLHQLWKAEETILDADTHRTARGVGA